MFENTWNSIPMRAVIRQLFISYLCMHVCLRVRELSDVILVILIGLIFFFQMDFTLMEEFLRHINFYDTSFCVALIAIIFNPFFWNLVRITFICS